uniref:J domain-containing protein n=1 Tax=Kalanchoe fedtschenkoi TaxID=63787 RepID=A0A7N0RC67_KALFE
MTHFLSRYGYPVQRDTSSTSRQIQYAFELLTNPIWKRNYDLYNIDEHIHVLQEAKAAYAEKAFSDFKVPLLSSTGNNDYAFNVITAKNFASKLQDHQPWIVQACFI